MQKAARVASEHPVCGHYFGSLALRGHLILSGAWVPAPSCDAIPAWQSVTVSRARALRFDVVIRS